MYGRLTEVLKERNIVFQTDVPTATLSTFRIGGKAAMLVTPHCCGELTEVLTACCRLGLPYVILGGGTNLLFDDGRIEKVLISTRLLDAVTQLSQGVVAECGVRLAALAAKAAERGLSGIEFACGIPGTLGGALFMNAGAYGGEIADVVTSVEVFDPQKGSIFTMPRKALGFAYRQSIFQSEPLVVLRATLSLSCDEPTVIRARMQTLFKKRRESQPTEPSAGSTFRRPSPDVALSRLLDELGLKGLAVGGAAVSEKHAGFIVNRGGASAKDVLMLIAKIQEIVEREKGFQPIPEIRFISSTL